MEKQYEVLRRASLFLEKNGREPKIAELLLIHHLRISRTEFFAGMRESVPERIVEKFEQDVRRHVETGIPVQHLTGEESFYGRSFLVDEHVLIPRPETEELVLAVIEQAEQMEDPVIADIGTGSGAIAVTLALELRRASVFASDISRQALAVAKANASRLGADVQFLEGDFLKPLLEQEISPNVLVSNPPYIAVEELESLADTVKNFDPKLALFAENDGLAAYEQIMEDAKCLPDLHLLAFEIGHDQGGAVSELIRKAFPESDVQIKQDINGKDRIVMAHVKA